MRHSYALSIATAVAVLGCSGAQTKTPVVTRSDEGKSISPSGDSAAKRGTSLVRFVNAVPGSGDLAVSAEKKDLFGNVAFKAVTPYVETTDNLATFVLRTPGNVNEMATNTETMSDGYRYTLVALSNQKGGAALRVLRDELVTNAGKARIRIIHAAPGTAEVDVAVQGERDALFDSIGYANDAGFKEVDPATVTFDIRRDKGGSHLVQLPKMTLSAGRAYTIILTGTGPGKLSAIVFDDAVTGAPAVAMERPR